MGRTSEIAGGFGSLSTAETDANGICIGAEIGNERRKTSARSLYGKVKWIFVAVIVRKADDRALNGVGRRIKPE
jgi:hypothetical protein